jgi:Kdo2-lipid IVA lauroyltransferase/acyltransferase
MARPRKPAVDLAVYLAVRLTVMLVQALPPRVARGLASGLAWLAYHIDKRHRLVAADNLRHAFPDLPEATIDRRVRAAYRHFCTVAVEMMLLPRKLRPHNWREHVELSDAGRLLGPLLAGRPLLLVTGHFGNWEMAGYVLGLIGFRTFAIARVLDNPHLERFLRRFRERTGQRILAKKGEFDQIQALLAGGGVIATLADQDAGPRGLFVDFFGRPASTHKAVALMALQFGAVLMVVGVPKVREPMVYRVELADVIDPAEYAGRPDAARAITQRYTAALEQLVRRHPEQYFWLHRRWKHQPPTKKAKAA